MLALHHRGHLPVQAEDACTRLLAARRTAPTRSGHLALDSVSHLTAGNEAMRDIAVGLIVAIFIALFMIYVYQPSLFHTWLHRLFY